MMKKTAGNPLVQLLSSLEKQEDRDSYLILLQHSLCFSQRQTAASTDQSLAVYEHANVTPPSQRARRDSCGNLWISAVCHNYTAKLVWVETVGATIRPSKPVLQTVFLSLSASVDPLGWDKEENATAEKITMANLDCLAQNIVREATCNSMIVLESITPLVTLHGLNRTVDFLHQVTKQSSSATIVVPVLIESLTPAQHIALEDLADSVFILEGGEATLMRRGVRERANVLRNQVQFEIDDDGHLRLLSPIEMTVSTTNSGVAERDSKKVGQAPHAEGVVSLVQRQGKVTLRHEDDKVSTESFSTTPKPHIYLQDDDPEFADMDEEDPDDDLDI
jgi:hypothetical protein